MEQRKGVEEEDTSVGTSRRVGKQIEKLNKKIKE